MQSLQLELRRRWDFLDESVVLSWTPKIEEDFVWWCDMDHLLQDVSLEVQHPVLLFWSNASDQGWGLTSTTSLYPATVRIVGTQNVVADSLSHCHQVLGLEWTLAQEVVDELVARWPATVYLFASALNYRLPVYFSPLSDPMAAGTDAFLQEWDGLQAYAFPSFALIRQVLNKLASSKGTYLTLVLASEGVVPGAPEPLCGSSCRPAHVSWFT